MKTLLNQNLHTECCLKNPHYLPGCHSALRFWSLLYSMSQQTFSPIKPDNKCLRFCGLYIDSIYHDTMNTNALISGPCLSKTLFIKQTRLFYSILEMSATMVIQKKILCNYFFPLQTFMNKDAILIFCTGLFLKKHLSPLTSQRQRSMNSDETSTVVMGLP